MFKPLKLMPMPAPKVRLSLDKPKWKRLNGMPPITKGGVGMMSTSKENMPPEQYVPLIITRPTTGSGGVVNDGMVMQFAGASLTVRLAVPSEKPATVREALPVNE